MMRSIPKTLAAWMVKHPGVIQDVDQDSGFDTATGVAYDVLLAPGYAVDFGHIVIEANLRDLIGKLNMVASCDCGECSRRLGA